MDRLVISPVTAADHEELFAAFSLIIEAGEGYPQAPPLARQEFVRIWVDQPVSAVLARDGGRIVGGYYLKPNFPGRGAHIANAGYFVGAEDRGRGIGEALVLHSFDEARRLGFDAMQYNLVFESNPARRLYERLGFEAIGRIPDAIDGETAVIYWRRL